MARKRVGKKAMNVSTDVKLRPVRLDLTPEVHRLLRLVAADSNVSMASYAREALESHLREQAERLGIKAIPKR
jgi:hypothetical protein